MISVDFRISQETIFLLISKTIRSVLRKQFLISISLSLDNIFETYIFCDKNSKNFYRERRNHTLSKSENVVSSNLRISALTFDDRWKKHGPKAAKSCTQLSMSILQTLIFWTHFEVIEIYLLLWHHAR